MPLEGKDRGFGPSGVDPGGFGLGFEVGFGGRGWESGGGDGFELVGERWVWLMLIEIWRGRFGGGAGSGGGFF